MKSIAILAFASLPLLAFAACSSPDTTASNPGGGGDDAGTVEEGGASPGDAATSADAGDGLAEMSSTRSLFGSVTSPDGKVRVFDGLSDIGLQSSCEAYDEKTNT